ncbi:hypothetical protein TYRP_022190 [Tyrophagus putrescentiae]|nr:hypothetical protein TYRP_022190 [Tyrophagus putrescentiae]
MEYTNQEGSNSSTAITTTVAFSTQKRALRKSFQHIFEAVGTEDVLLLLLKHFGAVAAAAFSSEKPARHFQCNLAQSMAAASTLFSRHCRSCSLSLFFEEEEGEQDD